MGRLHAGQSVVAVARALNCSRQTIFNLRVRMHPTGTVADRPRPGASRVTSLREDQAIRWRHLGNRFVTATCTSREMFGGRITAQTVRNRLRAAGLPARRPHNGPMLTPLHRQFLPRIFSEMPVFKFWTGRRVAPTSILSNTSGTSWVDVFVNKSMHHRRCTIFNVLLLSNDDVFLRQCLLTF